VTVLQGLEEQTGGETSLTDGRCTDEDQVFCAGDEVEAGEASDLPSRNAGLALEGEGFESPLLGQGGAFDAPVECGLLLTVPLGANQAKQKLLLGALLLLGVLKLVF